MRASLSATTLSVALLSSLLLTCPVAAQTDPPPAPTEFRNDLLGAIADFAFGSSAVGVSLLGELGAEYEGIRSFRQRRLLLQWDALLAGRGGILGNTEPYTQLYGGHANAFAEVGWRPQAARWSFYAGARAGGDLSVLARPDEGLSHLNALNNLDGVGGVSARGWLRAAVGVSFLDRRHSLVLVGFFQEEGRARAVYTPGAAFAEGGVAVRFDLAGRLIAELEGRAGRSGVVNEAALDTTDQTTYVAGAARVRGIFRNGVWLAGTLDLSRELDHREYPASHTSYDTADAPAFDVVLTLGVPFLWKDKRGHAP